MARIYLIDDHAMLRDGLRALLQAAGHEVLGESSEPGEALSNLRRLQPDILLLDLRLNDHSGLDLLGRLRAQESPIKIIVLTMSAHPSHVAEALRLGANGYVLKGAPSAELLAAIQSVLQGQRYLGREVADLAVQGLTGTGNTPGLELLSARERQVVELVVRGKSSAEIAALLHLSPKTVETYRSRLMTKLGLTDVPALVRFAIRAGLITPDEP